MTNFFVDDSSEWIQSSQTVELLGWTLLHSLWQIALIGIVFAIVDRLIRTTAHHLELRYWLSVGSLMIMIAMLPATFIVMAAHTNEPSGRETMVASAMDFNPKSAVSVEPLGEPAGDIEFVSSPSIKQSMQARPRIRLRMDEGLSFDSLAKDRPVETRGIVSTAEFSSREASIITSLPTNIGSMFAPWLTSIVTLWICGVLVFLVRPALGWYGILRLRRACCDTAGASLKQWISDCAMTMRVTRHVAVRVSNSVPVPLLIGWIRPVILLPVAAVTGLSESQLRAVLAHELAHVARHDAIVNAAQLVVESVLFFHPVTWWLSGRVRDLREHCCDELAMKVTGNRREYVDTLIRLETVARFTPAATLSIHGGSLVNRIRRIATTQSDSRKRDMLPGTGMALMSTLMLTILTTLSALAMTSGGNARQAAVDDQPVAAAAPDPASPETETLTAQSTTPVGPETTWGSFVGNEHIVTGRLVDLDGLPIADQDITLKMNWKLKVPESVNSGIGRVQIKPTSDGPLRFETSTDANSSPPESITVITGGVQLTIESKDESDPQKASSAIDLSADRVVVWTPSTSNEPFKPTITVDDKVTLDALNATSRIQCFLEGNVTIRRASIVVHSARALLDTGSKRPIILDGDLPTEELVDAKEANDLEKLANAARAESRRIAGQTWGHCSATCKTDSEGRFSAPTTAPDYAFTVTGMNIESNSFMTPVLGFEISDPNEQPERIRDIGETHVRRLIPVSSRIIDPNGQSVKSAKVQLTAYAISKDSRQIESWRDDITLKGDDGTFSTRVPQGLDIGVIIASEQGAILRRVILNGRTQWPEFYLERGTTLTGRLLNRNGQPIVGGIVHVESDDRQEIASEFEVGEHGLGSVEIERVCLTDDHGNFHFSPMAGHFVVTLASPVECYQKDSVEFARCVPPVPFVPQPLHLDGRLTQHITLIESPTTVMSGRIVDNGGNAISGVGVRAMKQPMRGNAYIDLASANTDADGRYQLTLPVPLEEMVLHIDSRNGQEAWPLGDVAPFAFKGRLEIARVDGPLKDIDWKYFPEDWTRSKVFPDYVAPENDYDVDKYAADPIILELRELIRNAPKENPIVLYSILMHFEETHRGTPAGIAALNYVLQHIPGQIPAGNATAHEQAGAVVKDYYLNHYDVDLLINRFDEYGAPQNAEEILRVLIDRSPHRHVRAFATYQLAEIMLHQNFMAGFLNDAIKSYEDLIPNQIEETQRSLRVTLEGWKTEKVNVDRRSSEDRRTELLQLLDKIVREFADLKPRSRYFGGEFDVQLRVEDPEHWGRRSSIAEQAEFRRFQVLNLNIGSPAPDIEGTDLYHDRIRLSDLRGRIVVLTVSNGTVSEREMYERCAEILKQFPDKPVSVLSVISSDASGGYGVREIVRECKITWPIIRDSYGGSIASHWCIQTSPEAWLISPDGKLLMHETSDGSVSAGMTAAIRQQLESMKP